MNKVLLLVFSLVMVFTLTACGGNDHDKDNTNEGNPVSNNSSNEQVGTTDESNNENSQESTTNHNGSEGARIKMIFNNEEVIVKMDDNPTSRDFLASLPLTIKLEDHAETEKISYLTKKLSTAEAPSGSDPSIGDFAYYSPWGNLAIYYKDFGYSNGLIKLGKIETGIEKLASMSGEFTVTIEKMD